MTKRRYYVIMSQMARKDPEEKRKYQRELMARRRAEAKKGVIPPTPNIAAPISTVTTLEKEALKPNKPLPAKTLDSQESDLIKARRLAAATRERLDTIGWCVWECPRLNNDRLVIIRDELVTGYPPGLPVYTEFDLERVVEMSESTFRLFHEAKKQDAGYLPGFRN